MNIIAFSGSLREKSYNSALVRAFQSVAPGDMKITLADISAFPLYNEDTAETGVPAAVQLVKDSVQGADGIIFATPEYNRSIPGVLKNAIDWISRPYGDNSFAKKPVLVSGVSSGKIGTAVAQNHLRSTLLYLDAVILGQPELYLGPAKELFDEHGALIQDATKALLIKALDALKHSIQA